MAKYSISYLPSDDTLDVTLTRSGKQITTFKYEPEEYPVDMSVDSCLTAFALSILKQGQFYDVVNEIDSEEKLDSVKKGIRKHFSKFAAENGCSDNNSESTEPPEPRIPTVYVKEVREGRCSFSTYVIKRSFEMANRSTDRASYVKNLSMLTNANDTLFAPIEDIKIIPKSKRFLLNYYPAQQTCIAFTSLDSGDILVFQIQDAGIYAMQDTRNVTFYYNDNPVIFEPFGMAPVLLYDLDKSTVRTYSRTGDFSGRQEILTPALNYYYQSLNSLSKAETQQIRVDLDLTNEYYSFFANLYPDDNQFVLPVIGEAKRIDSITIRAIIGERQSEKYHFYEAGISTVDSETRDRIISELQRNNIHFEDDVSFCVLNEQDLSDTQRFTIETLLQDINIRELLISYNIEGERIRLNRIIDGFEKVLGDRVANPHLVDDICMGDTGMDRIIEMRDMGFFPDIDLQIELAKQYPNFSKNSEQLDAIDKVLQMDENDVDFVLIQGPPGTGKTELILALSNELIKRGNSLLVTSNVHIACDNVVERLKNNRELFLKRYTTVRGPQYEEELLENQRLYVEKQVLAGFEYNESEIASPESYQALHMQQSIVEQRKKILRDICNLWQSAKQYHVSTSAHHARIAALNDTIQQLESTISDRTASLDATNNEIQSVQATEEEHTSALRKFYAEKDSQKGRIVGNENDITRIRNLVDQTQEELFALNDKLSNWKDYDVAGVAKEIVSHYLEGTDYSNAISIEDIEKQLPELKIVMSICQMLKEDHGFWLEGTDPSPKTVDRVFFFAKDHIQDLHSVFCEEVYNSLDDIYQYYRASDVTKAMMSASLKKINGKNKAQCEELVTEFFRDLRNLQYSSSAYIQRLISDSTIVDCLQENRSDIESKRDSKKVELNDLLKQLENAKELSKGYDEDASALDKQIGETTSKVVQARENIKSLKNDAAQINEEIVKLRGEIEKVSNDMESMCTMQHGAEVHRLAELLSARAQFLALGEEDQKYVASFSDNMRELQSKDAISQMLSANLESLDRESRNLAATLSRIDDRIALLELNGFSRDEAHDLVFSYINDLKTISNQRSVDNLHSFDGRGVLFNKRFQIQDSQEGSLISMTTNQIAALLNQAQNISFDYAIVDEASKCQLADLIIALPHVKHLVLIGDFMQLDPLYEDYSKSVRAQSIFPEREQWDMLNKSVFSQMLHLQLNLNRDDGESDFDDNPCVAVLKKQYRMNRGIFNIVAPIYKEIHSEFELVDEKQMSHNDVMCIHVEGEESKLFDGSPSWTNEKEARAIAEVVLAIQAARDRYPSIKKIGIIAGYRDQVKRIRRLLGTRSIPGVQIGTFDNFQGREYDLVLLSLVRTKRLGFLTDIRRMNVAFSRAMQHLLVFGNYDALYNAAMQTPRSNGDTDADDTTAVDSAEAVYVKDKLIPYLYAHRERFLSDEARTKDILKFIKEVGA